MQKTKDEQDKAYTNYIYEHIANVAKVWGVVRNKLDLQEQLLGAVDSNIAKHDMSKLSADEFLAFRKTFFKAKGDRTDDLAYLVALNHHYKRNPHHWEYWITEDGTVLEMAAVSAIEMVCDWTAMSLKFSDTPSAFYAAKAKDIRLGKNTRAYIEAILPTFDSSLEELL